MTNSFPDFNNKGIKVSGLKKIKAQEQQRAPGVLLNLS